MPNVRSYKVLVYGTLRKHGRLNCFMRGAEYVKTVKITLPQHSMFSLRAYPAVIKTGKTNWFTAELWNLKSINSLRKLDELEGYPFYYDRIKIKEYKAWLYCMSDKKQATDTIINDWIEYVKALRS